MTSYYDALGVAIDADLEEVRRAYLRKAQQLHPDRHAGSPEPDRHRAEAEMKALNEAWNTLKSPEARRRYDMELGLVVEPPPRRSPLRRVGVRLAIVVLLVFGMVGSAVALFSHQSDQSHRWTPAAVDELRQAAVNAGMPAPQADCFVRTITKRYAPSDAVDRSVIEQTIDGCR